MRTSGRGNSRSAPATADGRGFTLIELLVVVAIVAIAAAGVSFAIRDTASAQLERDALRLAAVLESARAGSRASGLPVRWHAVPGGFEFEGLIGQDKPQAWLSESTTVNGSPTLVLGPEPIIGPQSVTLSSSAEAQHAFRVATDGLRPFTVQAGEAP